MPDIDSATATLARRAGLFAAAVFAMMAAPLTHGQTTPAGEAPAIFEGARLIVGDGTVIENSAFVVQEGGSRVSVVEARCRHPPGRRVSI